MTFISLTYMEALLDNKYIRRLQKLTVLAAGMFIFNKIHAAIAVKKHCLSTSQGQFFNWKGIRVYYEKHGSGSPIVLLHALHPAASSFEWHSVIDALAEKHTVYTIDLPGCGRSDKPDTLFTNFYFVQLVRDFIKELSISHCVLVGSNLSAAVAVIASVYEPDLADKLIFVNPPSASALAETPDRISRMKYRILGLPLIGTFIYHLLASRMQIDLYFSEKYFYNPFHDTDDLVDTYFESALLDNGKGHFFAASLLGKYMNMNIEHALSELKVPAKLIEGSATDHAQVTIQEWKAIQPSIETVLIEHTRQLPMLEEPEQTAAEILNFIDK